MKIKTKRKQERVEEKNVLFPFHGSFLSVVVRCRKGNYPDRVNRADAKVRHVCVGIELRENHIGQTESKAIIREQVEVGTEPGAHLIPSRHHSVGCI